MYRCPTPLALFVGAALLFAFRPAADWQTQATKGYTLHFQPGTQADIKEYRAQLDHGLRNVRKFFGEPMTKPFDVWVYPDRAALDTQWQQDWQTPDFKSECWMVASGVGTKLDLLAPRQWDQQACEHRFADKADTERLLTHELVHVYHGQHNPSPDFSAVEGLDWLVEGLATYAAGQLTPQRRQQVRDLLQAEKAPATLDKFWSGPAKYGLAGSVVELIDQRYGRPKLLALLQLTKKADVLAALGITEAGLLAQWRERVQKS